MGFGEHRQNVHAEPRHRRDLTTAILILVALRQQRPRPMSTYELGLWIADDRDPPRPLSVIMKTLADDRYITRVADAGKRAGLWQITDRGLSSLEQRAASAAFAEAWLARHPNLSSDEIGVLICLLEHGDQTPGRLSEACSLLLSPVRTAVKKLVLRGMIQRTRRLATGYTLTLRGRATASRARDSRMPQAA